MTWELACKSCLRVQIGDEWRCPDHGLIDGIWTCDDPASGQGASVACSEEGCTHQAGANTSLPRHCFACQSTALEWRNGQDWYFPSLVFKPNENHIWICGDFMGMVHAASDASSEVTSDRSLAAHIKSGELTNVREVAAPPQHLQGDEPRPLRQSIVWPTNMLVTPKDETLSPGWLKVSLHDLRLHRWSYQQEFHAGESSGTDLKVSGQAYAWTARHVEPAQKPEQPKDSEPDNDEQPSPYEADDKPLTESNYEACRICKPFWLFLGFLLAHLFSDSESWRSSWEFLGVMVLFCGMDRLINRRGTDSPSPRWLKILIGFAVVGAWSCVYFFVYAWGCHGNPVRWILYAPTILLFIGLASRSCAVRFLLVVAMFASMAAASPDARKMLAAGECINNLFKAPLGGNAQPQDPTTDNRVSPNGATQKSGNTEAEPAKKNSPTSSKTATQSAPNDAPTIPLGGASDIFKPITLPDVKPAMGNDSTTVPSGRSESQSANPNFNIGNIGNKGIPAPKESTKNQPNSPNGNTGASKTPLITGTDNGNRVLVQPPANTSSEKTLDQLHKERVAAECSNDTSLVGAVINFGCAEVVRWSVCKDNWSDEPGAGKSICKGVGKNNDATR